MLGSAKIFAMSTVDLQALISFLTTSCKAGASNPLPLLSAAQLVRDLPVKEVALLQEGLDGIPLDPALAAMIECRLTLPCSLLAA